MDFARRAWKFLLRRAIARPWFARQVIREHAVGQKKYFSKILLRFLFVAERPIEHAMVINPPACERTALCHPAGLLQCRFETPCPLCCIESIQLLGCEPCPNNLS